MLDCITTTLTEQEIRSKRLWYRPARVLEQRQCDPAVGGIGRVHRPRHGLVLEDPFLPVREGSAVAALVLQLGSLQGGTGEMSPRLPPHTGGEG